MVDLISKCPLFSGIDAEELSDLLSKTFYQIRRFKKGEIIVLREDTCNHLMIIIKGSVKGEMLDFSGKTIKIEDIEAPRPIASAFLFGQNNRFPVDVVGNEAGELFMLPKPSVIQLFMQQPVFLQNYLDSISNRAQFLSTRLYFLSFKTIRGKLAQYILSLSKPEEQRVIFPKTQQEMAEFFGVTRPALARVMGQLEREQIIQVNRKVVSITNRDKLIHLVR